MTSGFRIFPLIPLDFSSHPHFRSSKNLFKKGFAILIALLYVSDFKFYYSVSCKSKIHHICREVVIVNINDK